VATTDGSSGVSVVWLTPVESDIAATERLLGSSHPHRPLVDRAVGGDRNAESELETRYDAMASIWSGWASSHADYYDRPLREFVSDTELGDVLELSAGTGQANGVLTAYSRSLVSIEPSEEMILATPLQLRRRLVRAASGALPFAAASFDTVAGLNAIAVAPEVDRVLRAGGRFVMAYSFAEETPVFVEPATWAAVLGWRATAQRVGPGLVVALTKPGPAQTGEGEPTEDP
jgi:SAM-dependent methyltransferase